MYEKEETMSVSRKGGRGGGREGRMYLKVRTIHYSSRPLGLLLLQSLPPSLLTPGV
jgi:hypothetical protein